MSEDTVTIGQVASELANIRSMLENLNSTPSTAITAAAAEAAAPAPTQGVEDQAPAPRKRILSGTDLFELRKEMRTKSDAELSHMFSLQARRKDVGIPFDVWAAAGGHATLAGLENNPDIVRALDTSTGSALIRQDLEPVIYELFVRQFPAFERFAKEPANGLVHTWTDSDDFGDAVFMTELGTVTDDRAVYTRRTTNVAVLATRRGVSLKHQFATVQSGSGFNPEQLELRNAMRSMAFRMQKTIFQGNANESASGGTASTEDGAYDANAFTGLRQILNTARAKDVNPFAGTPEDMRAAIDRACVEIMDKGGSSSIVYTRATDKTTFDLQQDKNVRYQDTLVNVSVGVQTNAVNTVFGPLPLVAVPGDAIGKYTYSSWGADNAADIYVLDESTLSLPYLGSEGPTILDIPVGISGQLQHLFIVFGMWGLAAKAIPFSNKVRVRQS